MIYYVDGAASSFNGGTDDGAIITKDSDSSTNDSLLGDAHIGSCRTRQADGSFVSSTTTHGFFTGLASITGYTDPGYIWEIAEDDTSEFGDYNANYILFYIP